MLRPAVKCNVTLRDYFSSQRFVRCQNLQWGHRYQRIPLLLADCITANFERNTLFFAQDWLGRSPFIS